MDRSTVSNWTRREIAPSVDVGVTPGIAFQNPGGQGRPAYPYITLSRAHRASGATERMTLRLDINAARAVHKSLQEYLERVMPTEYGKG